MSTVDEVLIINKEMKYTEFNIRIDKSCVSGSILLLCRHSDIRRTDQVMVIQRISPIDLTTILVEKYFDRETIGLDDFTHKKK